MMRRLLFFALLSLSLSLSAQTDWKGIQRLIDDGSYKTAYAKAEAVYNSKMADGRQRLTAAYWMAQAAALYQEDARDSAVARYRSLLAGSSLSALDRALCYAFLGVYDTALVDSALLQRTPVEAVREFCDEPGKAPNMTPTVYDMLVVMMQDRGGLTPQQLVEWQQRLCAFHAQDKDDGLRIWHDRRLLDYMEQVPNHPMKLGTYQRFIDKYRGTKSSQAASLYQKAANHCRWKMKDLVQAVRYCDTAIARWPKSEGGVECANIRSSITAPRIELSGEVHFIAPQREELLSVDYRNLSVVHLRLIKEPSKYMSDEQLAKQKPLREWTVEVPLPDAYGKASAAFALPPLPIGKYRLLAAPTANFAKGLASIELHVTDIALRYTNDGRGLVVDRVTGAPVVGQKVQLVIPKVYHVNEERLLQTVVTNADGLYRFDSIPPRNSIIRIARNGYNIEQSVYNRGNSPADGRRTRFHMVSDRPVYRPGDTVQVAAMLYRSDGRDGELLAAGHPFELTLVDPNGQEVQRLALATDDFGSAHCSLPLPTDRLAGHWMVRVQDSTGSDLLGLRVEEYKQPRFMVSLAADGPAPRFGQPCTVQGMAAAYSGVSIGGARVQYTVTRSQRLWRWGPSVSTVVAQGETQTAADGTFSVAFIPEPDSSVELSAKPVFNYRVQTTVTDLNGESHDAETTLHVGYRNIIVRLKDVEPSVRELQMVKVDLTDINNTPQQGRVEVSIERLQRPAPMRLTPSVLKLSMHQTLDSADYRRRFPQYIYDIKENNRQQWVTEWRWTGVAAEGKVAMPPLQGGIYRIVAFALDGRDTVADTVYTVLAPAADHRSRTDEVLWADQDKATAQPGERVVFRVGSAFKDVKAFYWIEYGDRKTLASGWLTLGERLQEVSVDVDSAQLGGFTMTLSATYMGQTFTKKLTVEVPYTHKQLKVEIATFRDRLQPGESEEWTIKVEGEGLKAKEPTALVLTMYDDALNTYGTQSWGLSPWRGHSTVWQTDYSPYFSWGRYDGSTYRGYNGIYPSVWRLKDGLPYYNRWRGHMMYKTAAARNAVEVTTELAVIEDDAVMDVAAVKAQASGAIEEEEAEEAIFSIVEKDHEVQVRTNLSTLAFFAPALRTDADGILTYRFTVPELLTRWNVRGLAVTKDLKSGTLDKTLVTQKPLMVQPNMPRFLRHGDSLSLMAKVVMSEPTDPVDVTVTLLLTDAATGDTICNHAEQVTVRDAAQVMFDVEVPQNVYVATYRIVATAAGGVLAERRYSDGEQGQVPVVSNRQAVTVSQAMYINGAGEKHYTLPEWQAGGATRQPQLVVAEAVSNPVWLAIKAMPYMKTMENPSTLYLANQLYVNGLGAKVLEDLDVLDNLELLDNLGSTPSHLAMNEDVKQTALQATPWLRDAESEDEQMRAVKNYFDTAAMQAQHAELVKGLAERQNGDGGWPWMPEGKSSLWVTQQVLQKVCGTELNPTKRTPKHQAPDTKRALTFVDGEQQRYYERYVKPYAKKYNWQPTDIDYLYMRSLYGKASTEAYKFYYSNALKNYKQYGNLYTQAQLALVFHRHGDKKEALDLLRRLKEKSLVNDEMGLYWRDNRSGWYWYSRPIETQALLVQAFAEITPQDTTTIGLMQQWLLKQKQTTHWGNERATAEAIKALMVGEKTAGRANPAGQNVRLTVLGDSALASATHHSADNPEGYISHRWSGSDLDALVARRSSDITLEKTTPGIAWGAVYYQFTDDMDKIPASDMGIKISRNYVTEGELHVGDRIKVRIEITADRAMDYLELVDGRPSCTEPLSTRAGWRWNDGLSYYVTVNNTDTRFYIEHIDKGHYVAEYELYVTNPGTFLSGAATMQCMYAPEFRAVAPAVRLTVE